MLERRKKKKVGLGCCLCVRGMERGYECERESVSIRENKPELCCINRGLEENEIAVCEGVAAQCPCCEKTSCCVVQVRRS